MPKRPTRDPKLTSRNPLTRDDAGRLAEGIAHRLDYDARDVAALLLLIHSLAYEDDASARENMLIESTSRLAVYLDGVDAAAEAAMRAQLDALTKGGGR